MHAATSATRSVREVADQEAGAGSHSSGRLHDIAITVWRECSALLAAVAEMGCRVGMVPEHLEQPGCFVLRPSRMCASIDAGAGRRGAGGVTHSECGSRLLVAVTRAHHPACSVQRAQPLLAGRQEADEAGGDLLAVGGRRLWSCGSLCGALRGDVAALLAWQLAARGMVLLQVCPTAKLVPCSRLAVELQLWRLLLAHTGTATLGGAPHLSVATQGKLAGHFTAERAHEKWEANTQTSSVSVLASGCMRSLTSGHVCAPSHRLAAHVNVPVVYGLDVAGAADARVVRARVAPPDRLHGLIIPNGSGTGEIPYWLVVPESGVYSGAGNGDGVVYRNGSMAQSDLEGVCTRAQFTAVAGVSLGASGITGFHQHMEFPHAAPVEPTCTPSSTVADESGAGAGGGGEGGGGGSSGGGTGSSGGGGEGGGGAALYWLTSPTQPPTPPRPPRPLALCRVLCLRRFACLKFSPPL